jgi:hypothetical protein
MVAPSPSNHFSAKAEGRNDQTRPLQQLPQLGPGYTGDDSDSEDMDTVEDGERGANFGKQNDPREHMEPMPLDTAAATAARVLSAEQQAKNKKRNAKRKVKKLAAIARKAAAAEENQQEEEELAIAKNLSLQDSNTQA